MVALLLCGSIKPVVIKFLTAENTSLKSFSFWFLGYFLQVILAMIEKKTRLYQNNNTKTNTFLDAEYRVDSTIRSFVSTVGEREKKPLTELCINHPADASAAAKLVCKQRKSSFQF